MASIERRTVFGISAEFDDAEKLLAAVRRAKSSGYTRIQAYSPYEVEGLSEAMGLSTPWLPWIALGALLGGAAVGFGIQAYTDWVYALNIGGRPLISWQSYTVISYEFGILGAALATLGGFLYKTGLPLPYHPIFNAPNIELASRSHFFLCISADDPKFNPNSTMEFMNGLDANNVSEVEL